MPNLKPIYDGHLHGMDSGQTEIPPNNKLNQNLLNNSEHETYG
jgi:hypothetical protein